ncbi:MAG TPA: hypothetical protein VNO50_10960 [Pyrinomonadaceae bacterium]|nr:hypothetical protein [Pyrinomonadaceae bacterium]
MPSSQSGIATIFGFPGYSVNATDWTWTGIGTLFPQNFEFRDDFKLDILSDQDNEPQTVIASGQLYIAKLNFTPRAAAGTNTIANAKLSLAPPTPIARVTLANFMWAGANSATWFYAGGWRIAFTKDGIATYELEIRKSPNRDLTAAVT